MPTQNKQSYKRLPPLTIRGAKLLYLNMAGAPKEYNAAGMRNFLVVLDPINAAQLEADGWNIKWKQPKDAAESPYPTMKVHVRFDNYPPSVTMFAKGKRIELNQNTVSLLDRAKIEKFDIVVVASHWGPNAKGESGYKTYLQQMFATLSPDDLEADYVDL
jgi:hypothetical protein